MNRFWLGAAAILGFVGVAAGAFGAHGLEDWLTPSELETFEIGARYQMYHAVALLAVAALATARPKLAGVAGWGFLIGIVIFSGSLYLLAMSGIKWLGAITPIGGVAFLVGWFSLAVAAFRNPANGKMSA